MFRRSPGKRPFEQAKPEVWPALEKLVDPLTRGDPQSPLRWTCKSTPALAAELFSGHGIRISDKTVAKLLRAHGYSLQAPNKSVEGAQPDRNAQFEHINAAAQERIRRGIPVISVDTKKKELVGNFKNGGQEWHPVGEPELVDVHEFPRDAVGKAIPYRVYDLASNDGFVSVGVDHDTPVFAVKSIEAWWKRVGQDRCPNARELFITADAGGSNSYRSHVWKPRAIMKVTHVDPEEAVQAFLDLGARVFVPMHYGTFLQGAEPVEEPLRQLDSIARRRLAKGAVAVVGIGEERVLVPKDE